MESEIIWLKSNRLSNDQRYFIYSQQFQEVCLCPIRSETSSTNCQISVLVGQIHTCNRWKIVGLIVHFFFDINNKEKVNDMK